MKLHMIALLIEKSKKISINWSVNSIELKCEKHCTECNRENIKIMI